MADAPALGPAARRGQPLRLFPIILETYRECLQDVFDLPALKGILAAIERREIRLVSVETRRASPFASSLMFDYIASYMYEGDAPLVDRRAQALALDRDLLRELLGAEELRELLDADALAELELELPVPDARPSGGLGRCGARPPASAGRPDRRRGRAIACAARTSAPARAAAGEWLEALAADRRAVASESAARSAGSRWRTSPATATRSASSPPVGVPQAFLGADRRTRWRAC